HPPLEREAFNALQAAGHEHAAVPRGRRRQEARDLVVRDPDRILEFIRQVPEPGPQDQEHTRPPGQPLVQERERLRHLHSLASTLVITTSAPVRALAPTPVPVPAAPPRLPPTTTRVARSPSGSASRAASSPARASGPRTA